VLDSSQLSLGMGFIVERAAQMAELSHSMLAAAMMLVHIGQTEVAARVQNAWLKAIEDGQHTFDIYTDGVSQTRLTSHEFAHAIIKRLGQQPLKFHPVSYTESQEPLITRPVEEVSSHAPAKKDIVGVDIFLQWSGGTPNEWGEQLSALNGDGLQLTMITNRGVKVYPNGLPETFCTDHWRCRFMGTESTITHIIRLIQNLEQAKFDFIKSENLCNSDGEPGYSLGQGQ
jgi:isocitrate dehydrogenase